MPEIMLNESSHQQDQKRDVIVEKLCNYRSGTSAVDLLITANIGHVSQDSWTKLIIQYYTLKQLSLNNFLLKHQIKCSNTLLRTKYRHQIRLVIPDIVNDSRLSGCIHEGKQQSPSIWHMAF